MKKSLIACALALASLSAHAQNVLPAPAQKDLRFLVGIGVTGGGDTLATVYYEPTRYDRDGSAKIRAGSGAHFYGGVDWRVTDGVGLQANIGAHIHFTPDAENGSADFRRFPLELLAYYYPSDKWRVGGGARLVFSPKLNGSGVASNLDTNFKDATGAVLEVEYFAKPNIGIKVRGVSEKYELEGGSRKISGNHAGVYGNFYF